MLPRKQSNWNSPIFWGECKMKTPQGKTVGKLFLKHNMDLPYDSVTPLLAVSVC